MVLQQGFPMLFDLGKANVPYQSSGLVTSRKYMRSNPLIVENLAKAVIEGAAFVQNPANKKTVVDSIARNLRLDRPTAWRAPIARSPIPFRANPARVWRASLRF